ncbi:hypothetical protein SELMODRAFT_418610 [Selaginella moellendorffii]|uniref:Uncharacterized protein n=1 Tax=Selaginella moellendorffii TaxID=88036 RepID=D8S6K7_SELML|nr:hypothetical protein SELMODRAFT_418610 [Selaginella moellendorffii]
MWWGLPDLKDLARRWILDMRPSQEFLLVSPKGDGKSCKLRALTSLMCSVSTRKVVCIWNMELASACLVHWFVDELKFSYAEQPDVTAEKPDRKKRFKAEESLKDIVESYKVIFGLSPDAWHFTEVERTFDEKATTFHSEGFTKEQLQTFMQHASVLGAVVGDDQDRQRDVEYYAAKHPHSLDILDKTCIEIASKKRVGRERVKVEADGFWSEAPMFDLKPEEVSDLLDSSEDWDSVISSFVDSSLFRSIRTSMKAKGDFSTDAQIINQIYVEEFRNKHAGDDHDPWVAYASAVVHSPLLDWSEAGWLCERFCNDVISRKGLLHIIGLHYTTNVERHLHSESEFMSIRELEKWYGGGVLEATRNTLVQLDYVFVCTTARAPEVQKDLSGHCEMEAMLVFWSIHVNAGIDPKAYTRVEVLKKKLLYDKINNANILMAKLCLKMLVLKLWTRSWSYISKEVPIIGLSFRKLHVISILLMDILEGVWLTM